MTDSTIDIPGEARRRLDSEQVVWLTTIADSGRPAPNPVWFVQDGDDIVVFSSPTSHRVRNVSRRPQVALNFNSDSRGGDVVVISGTATATPNVAPSSLAPYLAKYEAAVVDELQTTVEAIDAVYNTEIRIRPTSIGLT